MKAAASGTKPVTATSTAQATGKPGPKKTVKIDGEEVELEEVETRKILRS